MKVRSKLSVGGVVFIVVIIVLSVLSYYAYDYAVNSKYRISVDKAKELLKTNKVDVILDVRTDVERSTLGYYPNSVHIQSADLEKRMPKEFPNKDVHILAYCNTGHRARMATDKLHTLGYKNTVYIATPYTTLY